MENWFFEARYDRQISDSDLPGTNTTDNIYSIGLSYRY